MSTTDDNDKKTKGPGKYMQSTHALRENVTSQPEYTLSPLYTLEINIVGWVHTV